MTSGAFTLQTWKPYNRLIVVRNPKFWDAANVKLDQITFYPIEDATTMMNLYKAGEVDAVYNHIPPAAWIDCLRTTKDHMDKPEAAIDYYQVNTTKAPMNDVRVRKAFNMAIDKVGLAAYQRTIKPLTSFTPEGIFPGYPRPDGDPFDVARARQLLARGRAIATRRRLRPVDVSDRRRRADLQHDRAQPPDRRVRAGAVETESRADRSAEEHGVEDLPRPSREAGVQGLREVRVGRRLHRSEYVSRAVRDETGDNGTGWCDQKYVDTLRAANRETEQAKRYALMAKAEKMLLDVQAVIPLATSSTNWVKKPYVKGMYPNPVTIHAWKFVYIEHDPRQVVRFILRRLIITVPMVLIVVSVTWALIRLAPGNFYTGEKAIPPAIEKNLRERYGLDRPWYVQYGKMMTNTLRGDFGMSLRYQGQPVNEILAQAVPVSATLGLPGVSARARRRCHVGNVRRASTEHARLDYASMAIAMIGISAPNFVLGPILVLLFALTWYVLPPALWGGPETPDSSGPDAVGASIWRTSPD